MNPNPSPKAAFLADPEMVSNHRAIVSNEVIRRSFDVALMEMSRRLANSTKPDEMVHCASAHLRMLGAQDFVEVFMNLAENPIATTRAETGNLSTNTKKN